MSDIEARVKKIIAEQLGVPEADVVNNKAFVADLGADSLDTVELVTSASGTPSCSAMIFLTRASISLMTPPGVKI